MVGETEPPVTLPVGGWSGGPWPGWLLGAVPEMASPAPPYLKSSLGGGSHSPADSLRGVLEKTWTRRMGNLSSRE